MTIRHALLLTIACAWVLTLHMLLLAGSAPVVRRLTAHVAGWPAGDAPLRLALLSDTHPSAPGDTLDRLRRSVAEVNALRPDAVLLAGDYRFDGLAWKKPEAAAAVAPLGGLRAPLGVYAVLGNHDLHDAKAVADGLAAAGIRLMWNEALRLGPLAILGVADATGGNADVARTMASWRATGGIPVALTHSPDIVPELPPQVGLVLAGHTHCGQVRFPLIGAPVTQSRFGGRYACGVVREGARTIIVGAGLGTSDLPIRLGAAPDLWLVTIGR
ncbi:metallophosphoesterase [Sphingomonas sp.]|uniref:metallophosphoesterase n=1 Tax=Sphingomonas sp. TaxID=28214 RepID=UPI003B0100D4